MDEIAINRNHLSGTMFQSLSMAMIFENIREEGKGFCGDELKMAD